MTFRKSPKNILALALLLISGYAFSDSEYFYNDLGDGVEIAGCDGDCYLLPEHIDGKSVIGISDSAFNISRFTGLGWSLTWNNRFISETDSSYIDESAWFNNTENSPDLPILNTYTWPNDLPILILGQSPEGQDSDFEDRPLYREEISSNFHNLSSINIPLGYQYIGANFFSSNSLKNVSLNEGLRTIGMQAFASNGIRDIVIPDSVSEISIGAFSDNPLSHIIFLGNRPNIGDGAFLTRYDRASCLLAARENSLDASISCPYRIQYPVSPTQEGWADWILDAIAGSDYEHLPDEIFITDFDELVAIARQFPEFETFNSSLLKGMYPPKIYYCSGKSGWPGDPINGVVPEERNCDSVVWDIDQNNSVDALTDGLLLMRYAFGLRGDSLTENVISSDSLIDKAAVEQNIEQIIHLVDINDDGNFDALTDALILLRYLFDVTENGLVDEEMLTFNRPSAGSIKAYIESHMIKALSN